VAETYVSPDDRHSGAPRQEGSLQVHRAAGRGFGLWEVAPQRRAVRELQGTPTRARVERERAFVADDRPGEVAPQDEADAGDPEMGRRVQGVAGESLLERSERLVGPVERRQRAAAVAPGLRGVGAQRERPAQGEEGSLAELGRREVVAPQIDRGPEEHVGAGIVGIEGDSALEGEDGAIDRFLGLVCGASIATTLLPTRA
jgi:hypothetical protein